MYFIIYFVLRKEVKKLIGWSIPFRLLSRCENLGATYLRQAVVTQSKGYF